MTQIDGTIPSRPSGQAVIDVTRDGDWLPAAEFLGIARSAAVQEDVALDLGGIGYLEASALQTLLALSASRKTRGKALRLVNVSPSLVRWFAYAGAVEQFALTAEASGDA